MRSASRVTSFAIRFRRLAAGGAALCGVLGCGGGGPIIVEPSPNQHARVQGIVLIDGVPRAGVDVWNAPPALSGLFGAMTTTEADGHFDLLVQRARADGHGTILMQIDVFARPPVVATRIDDSVTVTITFAPLDQPPPVTVIPAPIELHSSAGSALVRTAPRRATF